MVRQNDAESAHRQVVSGRADCYGCALEGDQPMTHQEALASLPEPTVREALERVVVQLAGVAQRCTDAACRRDLMMLADELVHLVEGADEPEKAQQTH
jgi:hypothetical protein